MTREEKVLQLKQDFDEVYEAGKQAEYDAFWDVFQANGNRKVYYYAFNAVYNGFGWRNKIYNPKYEINCTGSVDGGAYHTFYWNLELTDTKVPINVRGVKLSSTFYGCSALKRIPLLKVNEQTSWSMSFGECKELQDLTIEGTIGQSGLDLHWSTKLSKASIESIIDHLDLTEGRPATSITLSLTAVNKAFETSEGANNGADSDEFNNLCASARAFGNWTISLV